SILLVTTYRPIAAATPIAGAPLTFKSYIASQISFMSSKNNISLLLGSKGWSIITNLLSFSSYATVSYSNILLSVIYITPLKLVYYFVNSIYIVLSRFEIMSI